MRRNIIRETLDSIYLIPMLLDYLDEPSDTTGKHLIDKGFLPPDIEELRSIRHLLEYHHLMIKHSFKENYQLLRKGLDEYYTRYLSKIFQLIDLVNTRYTMLDYGCGSGIYGLQFLQNNPQGEVYFLDRQVPFSNGFDRRRHFIITDFEENPNWWNQGYKGNGGGQLYKDGFVDKFNMVLLSELLHCKDEVGRRYLIMSSWQVLQKGGLLVIHENYDLCMLYRMQKIKNKDLSLISLCEIDHLINTLGGFQLKSVTPNNSHNIFIYEKI